MIQKRRKMEVIIMEEIKESLLEEVAGGKGGEKKKAKIINVKHLIYMMSEPNSESKKVNDLEAGEVVDVLKISGSWAKVSIGPYVGYIKKSHLQYI